MCSTPFSKTSSYSDTGVDTIKKGYLKYRDCDETLAIASRKRESFDVITMEETEVKTPFENHTLPGEVKPKMKT